MSVASPPSSTGRQRVRPTPRVITSLGMEREYTVVDLTTGRTISAKTLREIPAEVMTSIFQEEGITLLKPEFAGEGSDSAIEAVTEKLRLDEIDAAYDQFRKLQKVIAQRYGLALLDAGLPFTAPEVGFDYNHDKRYEEFKQQYGEDVLISLTENSTHVHLGTFKTPGEALRAAKAIRRLQAPMLNLSASTPLIGEYRKDGEMNLQIGAKPSMRPDVFKQVASVGERPDDDTLEGVLNRMKQFVRETGRPDLADNYEQDPNDYNLKQLLKQDHQWVRISMQGEGANAEWTVELRMLDPAPTAAVAKSIIKLGVAASEAMLQRDLPTDHWRVFPGPEERAAAWEQATSATRDDPLLDWEGSTVGEDPYVERTRSLHELFGYADQFLPQLGNYSDTIAMLYRLADKPVAEVMTDEWKWLGDGLSSGEKGLWMTGFFAAAAELDWDLDPRTLPVVRQHAAELIDRHEWKFEPTAEMRHELSLA